MMSFNIPIGVIRDSESGQTRLEMKAIIDNGKMWLPVDADIEEGDTVEYLLPNGKTQVLCITNTTVRQHPNGSRLDHTEADYTTPAAQAAQQGRGDTINHVTATNVQWASGDRSQQTMTIGHTAEELVLVVNGIAEILLAFDFVGGDQSQFDEARQAALDDVASAKPTGAGVRRFCGWILDRIKQGGTGAVGAVVTSAANGLLRDATALVHAISN